MAVSFGTAAAAIIAQTDWSESSLGEPDAWPALLRSSLRLLMPAKAPIALFWGPDHIAFYNEAFGAAIGYRHPQAFGRPAHENWAEIWDVLGPLLRSVHQEGSSGHLRNRPFRSDESGFADQACFDISHSPISEEDGTIAGVLCVMTETDERLTAMLEEQVALRTAERDRIWQVSRDLLGIADTSGAWQSVNPAWTRVLGWEKSEIVGRTAEHLLHPDDIAATQAEVAALAKGVSTPGFENRLRTQDGDYRTLAWTAVAVENRLYAVARDVTEERARERTLVETEEQLRQAQKMEVVGQLTGGIAHDFNNLLQVVTGNLETVLRSVPADAARLRRAANNAMTGAMRAATLTQRLLAFSRRQPLAPKSLDVNRLVDGMSELLHRTLGEPIAVETRLEPDPWRIEADPNQLESAILNLTINARDAMPHGGRLEIATSNAQLEAGACAEMVAGDYLLLTITDTGAGMDDATIARVFEPFFTTKDVGKGTGLGLSMVYGFVTQSGGHVRLRSSPGVGTAVDIYFPRLIGGDAPEQEEPVPAPSRPLGARAGETVLVCEDDDDVRSHSVEVLRELGYRVLEAADGAAALRAFGRESDRIDLLFTDVVLPGGITGAMVAQQARALKPSLRILFTTGYARDTIVHHGRLDPGVALITKPFAFADLAARIREMLDRE